MSGQPDPLPDLTTRAFTGWSGDKVFSPGGSDLDEELIVGLVALYESPLWLEASG